MSFLLIPIIKLLPQQKPMNYLFIDFYLDYGENCKLPVLSTGRCSTPGDDLLKRFEELDSDFTVSLSISQAASSLSF